MVPRALFWVRSMDNYRCFFVNAADHFEGFDSIEAASEADALIYAKHLLGRNRYTVAVEVWNQSKLVARLDRESARSNATIPLAS
jgi:hypothetical protein